MMSLVSTYSLVRISEKGLDYKHSNTRVDFDVDLFSGVVVILTNVVLELPTNV